MAKTRRILKNRIKEILEKKDREPAWITKRLRLKSKGAIYNVMNGRANPSLELAFRICKVLRLTVEEVFYYDD